jgi:hypothetical protein
MIEMRNKPNTIIVTSTSLGPIIMRRISFNDLDKVWAIATDVNIGDRDCAIRIIYLQSIDSKFSLETLAAIQDADLINILNTFIENDTYISEVYKESSSPFSSFRSAVIVRREQIIEKMRPMAAAISRTFTDFTISDNFKNIFSSINNRMIELSQVIGDHFIQPLATISETWSQVGRNFEPLLSSIYSYLEGFAEVFNQFEYNKATGWWNIDYVLKDVPISLVNQKKKDESKSSSFTRYLMNELRKNDNEKLIAIKQTWNSYTFLAQNRRKIILDAIDAHIARKYTLSIPALLPQIEYIFLNSIIIEGQNLKQTFGHINVMAEDKGKLTIDEKNANMDIYCYFEMFPIYYFYDQILFASEPKRNVQEKVNPELLKLSITNNRHLILHGEDIEYASEEVSMRVVLFMDKLLRLTK